MNYQHPYAPYVSELITSFNLGIIQSSNLFLATTNKSRNVLAKLEHDDINPNHRGLHIKSIGTPVTLTKSDLNSCDMFKCHIVASMPAKKLGIRTVYLNVYALL